MLTICQKYFEYLNNHDIRYCHWKSNEHLDEALAGKTDLDILVHLADKNKFENATNIFNIKKIISPPQKQFPGLEDYLGFDDETGRFIHVHVHYQLILGQKYIKNHHLPIEEFIFANLTTKDNVCIPNAEIELILLIIRANMKADILSLVKHAIRDITAPGYTAFPQGIEEELIALAENINKHKFGLMLKEIKLPLREALFTDFVLRVRHKKLKFYHILLTQWEILRNLKQFRRTPSIFVYIKYFRFYVAQLQIVRNFIKPKMKTLDGVGKVISLVGSDGSGKSTLIEDIDKWLSWKLAVKQYYYGIPKNFIVSSTSILTRGFVKLRLNFVASYIWPLFWIYVAWNRRSISISSKKDTLRGNVVITDRFPLKEFRQMPDPMDGPRLKQAGGVISNYFASLELKIYDNIRIPDRIFVLQVDLDELRKRKTDISYENHKIKATAVNSIKEQDHILLIDANKPYSEVALEIKKAIWEIL